MGKGEPLLSFRLTGRNLGLLGYHQKHDLAGKTFVFAPNQVFRRLLRPEIPRQARNDKLRGRFRAYLPDLIFGKRHRTKLVSSTFNILRSTLNDAPIYAKINPG